jgi:hypothetical protein
MIAFALHGYEGANPALKSAPLQTAFERRVFPCWLIQSKRSAASKRPVSQPWPIVEKPCSMAHS